MEYFAFLRENRRFLAFGYALSLTRDRDDAHDLLQDAWTSLLAANGPRSRAYLFKSIRSRWIDAGRRRQIVAFDVLEEPGELVDPVSDSQYFDCRDVGRAFATLRPEEREAI